MPNLFSWLLSLLIPLSAISDPVPDTTPLEAEKPAEAAAPMEGLWPSKKLMTLMLHRWAEETSDEYDLDETKREKVREAVVKRWMTFLEENRSDIQPLMNEFIEMRMELAPPEKERVQQWSEKALPVFDKFREQIKAGTSEFSEMLPPLKRAKFELEAMQFRVGMQFAEGKLKQWKEGEVKEDEFWEPRRSDRRRRRAERDGKSAESEAKPAPDDQITAEIKGWDEYVAEFIRIYELDEGQRTTAASCLSELKERAVSHRDRRKDDIQRLESRITANTGTKEELADIKKQLAELYGPIDDMFKELCGRLERIPTAAQRESVAERGKQQPPRDGDKPG